MKASTQPILKDLVLLGGGHPHAIALRMFGMKPLTGVRLTLITETSETAYSGMLPGYVAGLYSHEDCHINLLTLAEFADANLYIDQAVGVDLNSKQVFCANRPPVSFDTLSINIGSTPKLPTGLADLDRVIPAKPVRYFLRQWDAVIQQVTERPDQPVRLAIVGGGAGGVELALNMQRRLQLILQAAEQPFSNLDIHVLHRGSRLLPQHNSWVRDRLHHLLAQRHIQVHLDETVQTVYPDCIRCRSGLELHSDFIFWVTQAAAPNWLSKSGLATNSDGFVLVGDTLQSLSHPFVFAAGDIATMVHHPRPKAGVFAVRQGKPLVHNLRCFLRDQPTRPFRPQMRYLSLIGTADRQAIASWANLGWQSTWLWICKDRIDRQFMAQFSQLATMSRDLALQDSNFKLPFGLSAQGQKHSPSLPPLPCAGCGSKIGSPILDRVLQRIHHFAPPRHSANSPRSTLIGLDSPDDAAVLHIPPDKVLVQTIDYFTALINDPFLFGQIAANHALSDLYAMGSVPQSALAIATLPYAIDARLEETLFQLLSGAIKVLHEAGAELIGGHTNEGANLAFGLACNGLADENHLLRKGGMQPGQALILTKALGTGTLFAAKMRLQAKACWIDGAVASMLYSNQAASRGLLEQGATACTDITGFGLIGHLLEMVRASQVAVQIHLDQIPLLDGAQETARQGILSSLHPQNLHASSYIEHLDRIAPLPRFPLLFDPQTSGGLLASVPIEQAECCVQALRGLGYDRTTIIGKVLPLTNRRSAIAIESSETPEY